jgi:hypothetical protein
MFTSFRLHLRLLGRRISINESKIKLTSLQRATYQFNGREGETATLLKTSLV